jgi:glycosyltransferase involved in cell wall biosynthesis
MAAPRLSIVTPTYNRQERLGRVLGALDVQTIPRETFEVVVVDDGSSDGTSDWLERQHYGFSLKVLRQANSGPAKARNAGVLAAGGEMVLFLDDDVVPEPELVGEHLRSHEESNDLVVMGPLASLPHYRQPWVAWEQAKVEKQYTAMASGDYAPSFRQFWTGNASISRERLIAAGLFNAEFLRGEDVELGYRLHERGMKFRFNPLARGLHHAERSLDSWENAHRSYGRLEVQIFGNLGQDVLIKMLAENFSRLPRSAQWLLGQCFGQPRRAQALHAVLRGYLEQAARAGTQRGTGPVCSLLANLLYWQASREALGPATFDEVLLRVSALGNGAPPK